MIKAENKATKTFSLDQDILREVKRTKGSQSESERVNRLLRFALDLEKRAELDREAAEFFAHNEARDDRQAFHKASLATWERD